MSREHVWPDWFNGVLADDLGWTISHAHAGRGTEWERQTPYIDQTVRRVCKVCNETWMSALEAEAKELLTHMMYGNAVTLKPTHQELLMRWGYKTTLTLALVAATSPIPLEQYRYFHRERRPPKSVHIRIGYYSGSRWTCFFRNQALFMEGGDLEPTAPNAYQATMTFGRLLIQTIANHGHDFIGVTYHNPGAYLRLFPPKGTDLRWPTIWPINDADLEKVSKRPMDDTFHPLQLD